MLPKNSKNSNKKLYCEKCDYYAMRSGDMSKHLLTKKHNATNGNMNATKNSKFICDCNRAYKHKSSYYRHTLICKSVTNGKKMVKNDNNQKLEKFSCICGKNYNFLSGLSRHKKTCLKREQNIELADAQKTIQEQKVMQEKMLNTIQEIIPKIGNTYTNNINVQMFLDNECSNAMSIQEFTEQLSITLSDLKQNKEDCITNVILKNLKPLSITKRPFHCTNVQDKSWHVKDKHEGWEKDDGIKVMKNVEHGIQKKWSKKFEKEYPDWIHAENLQDEYVKIAGMTTQEMHKKEQNNLLKNIASEVLMNF